MKVRLPDLRLDEKAFSWQGKIEYAAADVGSKVRSAGTLRLEGIDLMKTDQDNQLEFKGKSLAWDGGVELLLDAGSDKIRTDLDGTLTGTTLVASLAEPPLLLEQGQLTYHACD